MIKSEKKIEIIQLEYWSCNNPYHHHKTEEIANKCIYKSTNKKHDAAYYIEISKRNNLIINLFKSGARKADLARQFGLSATRIHLIIAKFQRKERKEIEK